MRPARRYRLEVGDDIAIVAGLPKLMASELVVFAIEGEPLRGVASNSAGGRGRRGRAREAPRLKRATSCAKHRTNSPRAVGEALSGARGQSAGLSRLMAKAAERNY